MERLPDKIINVWLIRAGKQASALTSLVAVAISVALLLSLLHELAFYSNININYVSLLEATDYLKQSLFWAPFICLSGAYGTYTGSKARRAFERKKDTAILSGDVDALIGLGSERNLKTFVNVAPVALVIFGTSIMLPWPVLFFTLPLAFSLICARYSTVLFPSMPQIILRVGINIMGVVIIGAMAGYVEGYNATKTRPMFENSRIFTHVTPTGTDIYILRYLDKGVIGRVVQTNDFVFVPWSEVSKIETPTNPSRSLYDIVKTL